MRVVVGTDGAVARLTKAEWNSLGRKYEYPDEDTTGESS